MPHSSINPDHRPDKNEKIRQAELAKVKKGKTPKGRDLSGSAMLYAAMKQVWGLVETCQHFSVGEVQAVATTQKVESSALDGKLTSSIEDFVGSYNQGAYSSNPKAFFDHLMQALMGAHHHDVTYIKNLFSSEIKSLVCPALGDTESQRSLAFCVADAHLKSGGSSTVLSECLALLLGHNNALIGSTVSTFENCKSSHLPMPNIKKHQSQVSQNLHHSAQWQKNYTRLMQELNRGHLNVKELVQVVDEAPKGATVQLQHLAKVVGPLVKMAPQALGRAFASHFGGHQKNLAAIKAEFMEFMAKFKKATSKAYEKAFAQAESEGSSGLGASQGGGAPPKPGSAPPSKSGNGPISPQDAAKIKEAEEKWRHHVIHDLPVMEAMYLVLMSGQGNYGYLAKIMSNLGISMGVIKKFITDVQNIQDALNDFMKTDPKNTAEMQKDAKAIAAAQSDLANLMKQYPNQLSPGLMKALTGFAGVDGSLNDLAKEAGSGISDWNGLASNTTALQKLQNYMNNTSGGSTPTPVTTVIKNLSDLMGSLNTQNQGDVEKLNLTTKKVDSLTKLFAAAITMYKGIIQTLSNYAGS